VTVLDAAQHALERARARLIGAGQASAAATVTWQTGDVLTWRPPRSYRVWHDRAVFHFLTNPADRATYVNLAASAVTPRSPSMARPTAPGYPVARYGPDELAAQFAPHFASLIADDEQPHTPWGVKQHFTWQVLRRCIRPGHLAVPRRPPARRRNGPRGPVADAAALRTAEPRDTSRSVS
jgi:hypothetical protein